MCGRYYRTDDPEQLADVLRAELTDDPSAFAPGYNIAPTTLQPVLRQQRDTSARELVPMRWGLVGYGSPGIDPKRSTFNARAESLEQSSLWKRPLHRHRCLIPMNGYYEWRKADKQPFRFTLQTEKLFCAAGLWDAWQSPDGSWLQSYSIITTDPNPVAVTIHNRMPALLHPNDYDVWLDREETERPPIHLLRPFPANEMAIHEAHPKVGNVRNQGAEMLNSK